VTLQAEASGIYFGDEEATSECFRTEITYRTEQGPQKYFANGMSRGCIYVRAQINALDNMNRTQDFLKIQFVHEADYSYP
jgi:hypothetical protein